MGEFFVRRSHSSGHEDNVDTMASNIVGAAAAVVTACILSALVDRVQKQYYAQLLQRGKHRGETPSKIDDILYCFIASEIKLMASLKLGRKSEAEKLVFEKKLKQATDELKDPNHPRSEIVLEPREENLLVDTIVCAESINIWAMLMPAVYQLVPGSMIAKLWFNSIFPPPLITKEQEIGGTDLTYTTYELDTANDNVFSNLMVISCSLALGLIVGFAFVQLSQRILNAVAFWESDEKKEQRKDEREKLQGMYAMADDENDDPATEDEDDPLSSGAANGDVNVEEKVFEEEEEGRVSKNDSGEGADQAEQ